MSRKRKQSLRHVRSRLQFEQRTLAAAAGLSLPTVGGAERGDRIRLKTAYAILEALNTELQKRGEAPLEIDDLTWNVDL